MGPRDYVSREKAASVLRVRFARFCFLFLFHSIEGFNLWYLVLNCWERFCCFVGCFVDYYILPTQSHDHKSSFGFLERISLSLLFGSYGTYPS